MNTSGFLTTQHHKAKFCPLGEKRRIKVGQSKIPVRECEEERAVWVRTVVRASSLHLLCSTQPLLSRPDERDSKVHRSAWTWQAGAVTHRPTQGPKFAQAKRAAGQRGRILGRCQHVQVQRGLWKFKILDYQKFQISNNQPNHLNSPGCHAQAHRLWSCCTISRFSLFWKTQHLGTFSSTPVLVQCVQRDVPLLQISTQPIRSLCDHAVDAIYRQLWGWQKKAWETQFLALGCMLTYCK